MPVWFRDSMPAFTPLAGVAILLRSHRNHPQGGGMVEKRKKSPGRSGAGNPAIGWRGGSAAARLLRVCRALVG